MARDEGCDNGEAVQALETIPQHMPGITSLLLDTVPLKYKHMRQISQLPNLQSLVYSGAGPQGFNAFDPGQDCLFSATGQRSPFEGLTNLVLLHIDTRTPNVPAADLLPMTHLARLTHLGLHCAAFQRISHTHERATGIDRGYEIVNPLNEATYQVIASLPKLTSLSVDVASPYMTQLTGLQRLSLDRSEPNWQAPQAFSSLSSLTRLWIKSKPQFHNPLLAMMQPDPGVTISGLSHFPYVLDARFVFDAPPDVWRCLQDLSSVQSLTLDHCNLSNQAFEAIQDLHQLTSLRFTMSKPIRDGVDAYALYGLSTLTKLTHLHGKFVSRYKAEDPYSLYAWVNELPCIATDAVVLKWHQVPRDSDWMSDCDGSVSCLSGDFCKDCQDLTNFDFDNYHPFDSSSEDNDSNSDSFHSAQEMPGML